MKITHDGLVMLARVFISCNPIHGGVEEELQGETFNEQGLSQNQQYLVDSANSGQDFEFDAYVAGLPNKASTHKYVKIRIWAEKNGREAIDEDVVLRFFGGREHVAKASNDIKVAKVGNEFGQRILFAHLVMPVRITEVHGEFFAGEYKNGDMVVGVKGLVPLLRYITRSENIQLKVGDVVLTHYASIISEKVSPDIEDYLLREQAASPEYVSACEYVQELDFEKFWNLSKWTKQIAKI
ncbi:MAG TPA: hypothetical protein VF817_04435 [Patescibacteria group bacterium]